MILGGLHQDLLRRVINGVTLKRVLNCFVGTAGVSGKPFTHCLLLIWAVFDAGYVARVILPNTDFSINFSFQLQLIQKLLSGLYLGNLSGADAPGKQAPELPRNYLESPPLLAFLVLPAGGHPRNADCFRLQALALWSLGLRPDSLVISSVIFLKLILISLNLNFLPQNTDCIVVRI